MKWLGVADRRCEVSFWGDENILKLIMMTVAQLGDYVRGSTLTETAHPGQAP